MLGSSTLVEQLDFAHDNFLRPNGHGGYIIRQSDLSSWSYCPLRKHYEDRARVDPEAPQPATLSATEYGTVLHYVLMNMEQAVHEGADNALEQAIVSFEHYWQPENIGAIASRITEWLPRQTYGGLRERGRNTIKAYYDLLREDDSILLALEYTFAVPLQLGDRLHTLTGTIDRLSLRRQNRKPYLSLDDFKGLALDTPLPTPTGWTTMGAVEVGDDLLGANGRSTKVTAKSQIHHRPCYRVIFDDSSSVVADNVHLWTVQHGPVQSMTTSTLSTTGVRQLLADGQVVRIPNADALDLPEADLPIDPYLLGAWLGDGNRGRGVISKPDQELFDRIEARGHRLGKTYIDPRTAGCQTRTILGLQHDLIAAGYLGHKEVPAIYQRGSKQQRLDLLRGLMDTDGSWNRKRRRAVFSNCNKALAESVRELVVSLGWKATVFACQREGYGKTVAVYDVCFTPVGTNPFSLSRKADLVDTLDYSETQKPNRRQIVSVTEVPPVPTQCIQVDAEDSLYLCGEQMVPTHNTGKQVTFLRHNQQGHAYAYASTQRAFWEGWPESGIGELETFDPEQITRLEDLFSSWSYRLHSGSSGEWRLAARRFRWINLKDLKYVDGGWRNERDYARLLLAVDGYIRASEAGAYPPNLKGEPCAFCSFRKTCGGVGLPDENAGQP